MAQRTTSVKVYADTHEQLRRLGLELAPEVGRIINTAPLIRALVDVAGPQRAALVKALREQQ
jgi:hypothetical protein